MVGGVFGTSIHPPSTRSASTATAAHQTKSVQPWWMARAVNIPPLGCLPCYRCRRHGRRCEDRGGWRRRGGGWRAWFGLVAFVGLHGTAYDCLPWRPSLLPPSAGRLTLHHRPPPTTTTTTTTTAHHPHSDPTDQTPPPPSPPSLLRHCIAPNIGRVRSALACSARLSRPPSSLLGSTHCNSVNRRPSSGCQVYIDTQIYRYLHNSLARTSPPKSSLGLPF